MDFAKDFCLFVCCPVLLLPIPCWRTIMLMIVMMIHYHRISQWPTGSCIVKCFQVNVFFFLKHLQAKVTFVEISKVTFLLSPLKQELKNGVTAADGKGGKKKTFYFCTPFCKFHQHRPMGNQCADCCCEMFGGAVQKMYPRGFRLRSKWGHTRACTLIPTSTHTHIQGQLNKKQINRVSLR